MEEKLQTGHIILPDHELYEEKRKVWNGLINRYPAAIFECKSEEDVVSAVIYAQKKNLEISVRGGGHHLAGTAVCDDGVMIDLSSMNAVAVDAKRGFVEVEGGATLADVDAETQHYGLATPTGTVSKTGIAGLALGGGFGYLRGKYGLTSDNIISVRMVTAAGDVIYADKDEHPELFWAVRGGGGNFGVVTSFIFQLHAVGPEVLAIDVMYDYKDTKQIIRNLEEYMEDAPDEVSVNLAIIQLPPAPILPEHLHNKRVVTISGMYSGNPEKGEEVVKPLRNLAEPLIDSTGVMPYTALQKKLDPMVPTGLPVDGTSLFFKELDDQVLNILIKGIDDSKLPMVMVQLWALHGEANRVSSHHTAFAVRDARFLLIIDGEVPKDGSSEDLGWIDAMYEKLLPYSYVKSSYLNGVKPEEQITKNTYAENYKKLSEIKERYDPDNLFCHNHNIEPSNFKKANN
ncbi:FAD-binding oxidoreductase [Virgibacillus byunsanensis]|uniref:FAD-binding oxidoreductase n=1 Tax=Virgibacillus byunsanensis TaxID=570945 RepID=A0ABW3LPQ1_9BACI